MPRLLTISAGLCLLLALGCGDDTVGPNGDLVGGGCTNDNQCQSICVTNSSHYPGGMCTVSCDSDAQCPPDAVCVDDSGGICAVSCFELSDCYAFGRGFTCDSVKRKGAGGDTLACRVD